MKLCPSCQKNYDDSSVFCIECGIKLVPITEETNTGFSIGDKNVVAGDVTSNIVHNENYNTEISHNESYVNNTSNTSTTTVINKDETKELCSCNICGKVILKINSYICKQCKVSVCKDCYDEVEHVCTNCSSSYTTKKTSNELKKFVEKLNNYDLDTNKGRSFVEQYIISGNKTDIIEFLKYCSDQRDIARRNSQKQIAIMWNHKCQYLVGLGFELYSDDKELCSFLETKQKEIASYLVSMNELSQEINNVSSEETQSQNTTHPSMDNVTFSNTGVKKHFSAKFFIILLVIIIAFVGIVIFNWREIEYAMDDIKEAIQISKILDEEDFSKENVIPKDNIIIEGYVKDYLEVVSDGILSYTSNEYHELPDICLTVDVEIKKSYYSELKTQLEKFKELNVKDEFDAIEINNNYLYLGLPGYGYIYERDTYICKVLELITSDKGCVVTLRIRNKLNSARDFYKFKNTPLNRISILPGSTELYVRHSDGSRGGSYCLK